MSHTQEKLRVSHVLPHCILRENGIRVGSTDQVEDARRLVACWNRLSAFTTREIEAGIDLVKLMEERDEAVKALRDVANNEAMLPSRYREISAILAKYPELS